MQKIPVISLQARHPEYVVSLTDKDYTRLAQEIFSYLLSIDSVFTEEQMLNASITLALYFEDIHSGLHQFEVFTKLYSEMYGRYLPFFDARTREECHELEDLRFVFWLAIAAERDGRMLNPLNESLFTIAQEIEAIWEKFKPSIAPNEALLDYLYCEETQEDVYQIKNVLIWLQNTSLLGRFFVNPTVDSDPYGVKSYFPTASKSQLTYAIQSVSCLCEPAGPLSLPAQLLYAEMIRLEMDDPDDEMAAAIEEMTATKVSLHKINGFDKHYLVLEDFRGNTFKVLRNSFDGGDIKMKDSFTHVAMALLSYGGEWHACGLSAFTGLKDYEYDEYCQKEQRFYGVFHDNIGQYESYIEEHGGDRLRFFLDKKEYVRFLQDELKINDVSSLVLLDKIVSPIMLYFEENGQMTTSFLPECVCHPDNPYYDVDEADAQALGLVIDRSSCSPNCLMYLIRNQYIGDARFNDFLGIEHGRHLAQDNLEFLARCMRRDIKSREVIFRRGANQNELPEVLTPEIVRELTLKEFAQCLAREREIRSRANKEWQLSRCSEQVTMIMDIDNRKCFQMSTQALKDASEQLAKEEFMVARLVPYVGKSCAPAACALLYNVMGKGNTMHRTMKSLRQYFDAMRMIEALESAEDEEE